VVVVVEGYGSMAMAGPLHQKQSHKEVWTRREKKLCVFVRATLTCMFGEKGRIG